MLNKTILQGNLTRDPEQFGVDAKVTKITIANNGFKEDDPVFLDCIAFGKTGDFLMENFSKGKQIIVEGRLQANNWENPEGEKRTRLELVIASAHFAGNKAVEEKAY